MRNRSVIGITFINNARRTSENTWEAQVYNIADITPGIGVFGSGLNCMKRRSARNRAASS